MFVCSVYCTTTVVQVVLITTLFIVVGTFLRYYNQYLHVVCTVEGSIFVMQFNGGESEISFGEYDT